MKKTWLKIVSLILVLSFLGTNYVFADGTGMDYRLSKKQIETIYNDLGILESYNDDLSVIASSSKDFVGDVTVTCYRLSNGQEMVVEYSGSIMLVAGLYDEEKGEMKRISYYRDGVVKDITYERECYGVEYSQDCNEIGNSRGQEYPSTYDTYGTITFTSLNSNNEVVQNTFTVSGVRSFLFSNSRFRINGFFQELIDLIGAIAYIMGGSNFFSSEIASEMCNILSLGTSNITVDAYAIGSKIRNTWNSTIEGTNASGTVTGTLLYGYVEGSNTYYYDYGDGYYDIDSLRNHYVAFANRIFRSIFYFNNTSYPISWNVYY